MLYEVHMPFRHLARAVGISNLQIFKSLRSARKCMLRIGNPNSFDMCSGCSKVYVLSFFLSFLVISFFKRGKIASPSVNRTNSVSFRAYETTARAKFGSFLQTVKKEQILTILKVENLH